MVSDWKRFEELVARIEAFLAPSGATVKSPDRLTDKITGEDREVDASIRMRIGSSDVLITIECRKRSNPQDVTWIEQLATKREQVGADKTIAVSSEGFTEPAKKAAAFRGIDLRRLEEISSVEEMKRWLGGMSVIATVGRFDPITFSYLDASGAPVAPTNVSPSFAAAAASNNQAPLLVRPDGTPVVTLRDLAEATDVSDVPIGGVRVQKRLVWTVPQDTIAGVPSPIGFRRAGSVEVVIDFSREKMTLNLSSIADYSNTDRTILGVVRGSVTPEPGHELHAELYVDPSLVRP